MSQEPELFPFNVKIVPVNFRLKYNPPTLGFQYRVDSDKFPGEYVHNVKLFFDEKTRVQDIVNELYTAENFFFNPKTVPRKQVSFSKKIRE